MTVVGIRVRIDEYTTPEEALGSIANAVEDEVAGCEVIDLSLYKDPTPIDTMTASKQEKQAHTLALLADAERALHRLRMEGTYMTYMLNGAIIHSLDAVVAAQRDDTSIGVGLHKY